MESVFIKRLNREFRTYPLGYNMKQHTGSVGIEVEVEGNFFRKGPDYGDGDKGKQPLPAPWTFHNDGSLRGKDNAEYVTNGPISFDKVPEAVHALWGMFSEDGTVLDESNRTSVHVHLNVQKFHLNRLCSLLVLYFSVEEILTAFCGEHRVGNLFCLRAKDASAIITRLKEYFRDHGKYKFSDGMHYCGLNPQAIHKLGSVEIRTLRGATEPNLIIDWVAILERIYELSKEYPNPQSILDVFSQTGPIGYLDFILGPHVEKVLQGSGYSIEQANNAMYEGIRLIQELCYVVPWEDYEGIEIKLDPFQRQVIDDSPHTFNPYSSSSPQTTYVVGNSAGWMSATQILDNTGFATLPSFAEMPIPATSNASEFTFDQYANMGEHYASTLLSEEQFDMWMEVQHEINSIEEEEE